jgi:hypothetical protein
MMVHAPSNQPFFIIMAFNGVVEVWDKIAPNSHKFNCTSLVTY